MRHNMVERGSIDLPSAGLQPTANPSQLTFHMVTYRGIEPTINELKARFPAIRRVRRIW